ncbi:deaminase domain-containing protein [Clostridium sp.]|uniref:deaminase domain-containing protein n=1 Tax=Clostridium sp. TaxID=1506 RepID=UPI0025BACE1A|nr:deaminase domain-containing protein [Clostridium sp.]MCI9069240.1 hypothetical protein [Clostridium sp.]
MHYIYKILGEDTLNDIKIRTRNPETGKSYLVPGDMSYKEWYDKYVVDKYGKDKAKQLEKQIKNQSSDKKQFEEYKNILGKNSPKTLKEFQEINYNNIKEWSKLKENFKIVNSYKVDFGYASPEKIVELDNTAFNAKMTRFEYEQFTGKNRRKIKNLSSSGNFAIMEFENKKYLAHSSVNELDDIEFESINGNKDDFILHRHNRKFKTLTINSIPRHYCTEAKMFEYIHCNITKEYNGELTILSELDMCESCRGVLEQFKKEHPNTKVNIISGEEGFNWRKRK